MIKLEKTDIFGWDAATRGMRNPMNSWDKSDTEWVANERYQIGPNDRTLMKSLAKAGPEHAKYLRMIIVQLDITAPFYWWKEFDTYKIGTVANSCSTMHKLMYKYFELSDFSTDHLDETGISVLESIISCLNMNRDLYFLKEKDKQYWWNIVQLLPTSYNQKRTVQLNYAVLSNMYRQRKDHKLDEWHTFCDWIKKLPYSELITGEESEK